MIHTGALPPMRTFVTVARDTGRNENAVKPQANKQTRWMPASWLCVSVLWRQVECRRNRCRHNHQTSVILVERVSPNLKGWTGTERQQLHAEIRIRSIAQSVTCISHSRPALQGIVGARNIKIESCAYSMFLCLYSLSAVYFIPVL